MSAVQFTALIRFPFPRGDFVDPPQANWDAAKDRALWKVISKSSKTSDLNWSELATRFQVPQAFLLQQAAWLYERHLEHVRNQMKKVGSSNAPTASGSGSSQTTLVGGLPMQRGGSHGSRASRTPSALSIRPRDSPVPRADSGTPLDQKPAPLSRTPSTNTITQSRAYIQPSSIRTQGHRPARPSISSPKPPTPVAPVPQSQSESQVIEGDSPDASALSSSSSSSSESDLDGPIHRSQLFKRPPRFQKQRPERLLSYDEDPEEGDSGERSGSPSLPFAQSGAPPSGGSSKRASNHPQSQPGPSQRADVKREQAGDVSSSMTSSASDAPPKPPGPLSPRHRAELARLSPRRAGTRSRKDGSEGTPSMGSSFSDIDDASISQSALEEALLSNIQHGRMSTLSQLRSRYL